MRLFGYLQAVGTRGLALRVVDNFDTPTPPQVFMLRNVYVVSDFDTFIEVHKKEISQPPTDSIIPIAAFLCSIRISSP